MLNIYEEELLPLRGIRAHIPRPAGAPAPHRITVQRWISRGIRGVRLETVRIGGSVYTSREALSRFIEGTNAADSTPDSGPERESGSANRAGKAVAS